MPLNVKFIALVESNPGAIAKRTIQAVRDARDASDYPQLLLVPLLSSQSADDLREQGIDDDPESYIVSLGGDLLNFGCDGLIVSGHSHASRVGVQCPR